jgi:Spx/MgsR family transcriptional regulator
VEPGRYDAGMASSIHLHGIPNCDTVKKARAWLQARGLAHEFVDFKKTAPDAALLARWIGALGSERLLNRKGTTWRALDAAAQAAAASEAGAIALMAAQPSVIKRPVVQWADGSLSVGFDEADWRARTGG